MNPWLRDARRHLEQWMENQNVDETSVSRIVSGMQIAAQDGRAPQGGVQRPELFIPDLEAKPWWDRSLFPWIPRLEESFADIRSEFVRVGGSTGQKTVNHPTHLADKGRWSAYYFHYIGRAYPKNIEECPATADALSVVPGIQDAGMCYFSVLDAHTHVAAHCGFTNAHLRCHLALVVPDDARMRVGDETRGWKEGEAFVFDDSFEHEVWNDSGSYRAVLLLDTWHPDLSEVERAALTHMMKIWRNVLYRELLT